MRFLVDALLPPEVAGLLTRAGHPSTTPTDLGAHNLPDDVLVGLATQRDMVIVTENAADFAGVVSCPVLLVRKAWWPTGALPNRLAAAVGRWAATNPQPGPWPHWLTADLR